MRKLILVAAACMIAAPVAANELRATDFSSQGVYIEGPGVGVRVGPNRDRHDGRRHHRWRDREVRGNDCRTVTVRETMPDGTRVSRTRTRC